MEFILEEIDIKDELDTDDLDTNDLDTNDLDTNDLDTNDLDTNDLDTNDHDTNDLDTDDLDLGSSSHCLEWKLNPNVECRAMLEKSLQTEEESQRYSDGNGDKAAETSSGENDKVDKPCGVYRKLKLLVDVLKNCEKRDNCGLCEKYIRQLQQHLLFSHGNNRQGTEEMHSIEIETTTSISETTRLNRTVEQNVIHAVDPSNISEDEFLPLLTIRTEDDGEPFSQNEDSNTIKCKLISKVGKSKPFKCETCGKCFLTFYDLTQHKSEHNDDTRNTQKSNEKFVHTSSDINRQGLGNQKHHHLIRHSRTREVIHNEDDPYKCGVCGKCFKSHSYLTQHKLVHTGKPFTQNCTLTKHKSTHIGVKPHGCDVCGKYLANSKSLNVHKRTHTGDKPYNCDVCGKAFTQNSGLSQHKRIHTGEKPYTCDVCEKSFNQHSSLNHHKLIHTGEKPFKCDVCKKTFNQCANLNHHKLTHTGEKPFKCELCGKHFAQNGNLLTHILRHTRETPYKC